MHTHSRSVRPAHADRLRHHAYALCPHSRVQQHLKSTNSHSTTCIHTSTPAHLPQRNPSAPSQSDQNAQTQKTNQANRAFTTDTRPIQHPVWPQGPGPARQKGNAWDIKHESQSMRDLPFNVEAIALLEGRIGTFPSCRGAKRIYPNLTRAGYTYVHVRSSSSIFSHHRGSCASSFTFAKTSRLRTEYVKTDLGKKRVTNHPTPLQRRAINYTSFDFGRVE